MRPRLLLGIFALALPPAAAPLRAQQVADTTFAPPIAAPAWGPGQGPVVLLDAGHGNFHTASGRYRPFAELLRRDGYVVRSFEEELMPSALQQGRVLVIANALAERNQQDWSLPTPSPFTAEEIAAVRDWVAGGGALFLIADHMPFGGAAQDLAAAFGVRWSNGFAVEEANRNRASFVFRRSDGSLADHAITRGRTPDEHIDSVATFTGSAFQPDSSSTAEPLLVLGAGIVSLLPQVAWEFAADTPRVACAGWPQGAVLRIGEGRVALFGEAAMFSAQLGGPDRRPMGMNAPIAPQNPQFLLNVVHWLSEVLEPPGGTGAPRGTGPAGTRRGSPGRSHPAPRDGKAAVFDGRERFARREAGTP